MMRLLRSLVRLARPMAVAGVILLAATAAGRWAYRHYTDPVRLQRLAREFLERATSCNASIGAAVLVDSNHIRFDDVRLADAIVLDDNRTTGQGKRTDAEEAGPPWLTCARLELAFDPIEALLGRLEVSAVEADEPTLYLPRLAGGGLDFAWLRHRTPDAERPRALPPLALRRVGVVFSDGYGTGPAGDVVRLDVTGAADPGRDGGYAIEWSCDSGDPASGRIRWDEGRGILEDDSDGTPWLTREQLLSVLRALAPNAPVTAQVQSLMRRYTVSGAVRVADYRVDFSGGSVAPPSVSMTVELRDAAFSIPAADLEADRLATERYLRFEGLGGSVQCDSSGADFHLAGSFHEARFDVTGRLSPDPSGGWSQAAALGVRLDADVRGLVLPSRNPAVSPSAFRLIEGVHALTKLYNDYDPSGPADLRFSMVKRPGAGEPADVPHLELIARGGTATCRFFPYHAEEVYGTVEFTPIGVFVRDMRARHGNGAFVVNAWTSGTSRSHAARIHVTGTNISLDDDLRRAMPINDQAIFGRFSPSGTADLRVIMARPDADVPGTQGPWHTRVEAGLRGVSAEYDEFPYPLDGLTGDVVIDGGRFTLDHLEGEHGGAAIVIDGTVVAPKGHVNAVDLTITAVGARVDAALCGALDRYQMDAFRAFNPDGTFDAACRLGFDAALGRVTYAVDVQPRALTIRHDRLAFPLTCTSGSMRIDGAGLTLIDVGGRLEDSDIVMTLNGRHGAGGDAAETAIEILTECPSLDSRLAESFAPFISAALKTWRVEGAITCRTTVTRHADDPPDRYHVQHVVRMRDGRVARRDGPLAFDNVRADIVLDGDGLRVTGAAARLLNTDVRFDLSAAATPGGGLRCTAAMGAEDMALVPQLLALLPPRARAVAEALLPSGRVDVHVDALEFVRAADDAPGVWSVHGAVVLRDLELHRGLDLRDADVTFTLDGQLVDSLEGSVLYGEWTAPQATLLHHPVTDLTGRWSLAVAADGPAHLALTELVGHLYGGDAVGEVELAAVEGRTSYDVQAMVSGVSVARLFTFDSDSGATGGPDATGGSGATGGSSASAQPTPSSPSPARVRGLLEGRLHLTGEIGDLMSRRGAGGVRITEAHMYRLPVLLAILNVFNLTIPDENAFHEVEADFLVEGNRIRFDDILLHGKALALIGNGTLHLPGRRLDLYLATVSPHRWARVPMLTEFLEAASREIIELHVTGTLARPQVTPGPLRSLKGLIRTLFQKRQRTTPSLAPE